MSRNDFRVGSQVWYQPSDTHDHLRSLEAALSDAEWNGREDEANRLRMEIDRVRRDIERGELWEVLW